jgi:hypothetical protein
MSDLENNPPGVSPAAEPEANNQDLRRMINILFAGLILTSFTVTAYLGLQMRRAAEEESVAKAQLNQIMVALQQEDANLQYTYEKVAEFAHKHPDFQNQLFSKYKLTLTTNAPAK